MEMDGWDMSTVLSTGNVQVMGVLDKGNSGAVLGTEAWLEEEK